jgi:hypothetical protein
MALRESIPPYVHSPGIGDDDDEATGDIEMSVPSACLRFFLPLPRRLGVCVGVSVSLVSEDVVSGGDTMTGRGRDTTTIMGAETTTGGIMEAACLRVFLPLPRRRGVEDGVDVPLIVKKRRKRGKSGIKIPENSHLLL